MNKLSKINTETPANELVQVIHANKSIMEKVCRDGVIDYSVVLKEPTVVKLIDKIGLERVRMIITGSLMILQAKLNIKHKMDELQIELFINDLLDVCKEKDYRLEELVYFFNEVGKSKYGKIYERLDGALLFEFLGEYEKQSAKAVEEYFRVRNEQVIMGNEQGALDKEPFVMSEASKKILEEAKQMLIEKNKKPLNKPLNNGLKELSGNVNSYIEQQKEVNRAKEIEAWDGRVVEG